MEQSQTIRIVIWYICHDKILLMQVSALAAISWPLKIAIWVKYFQTKWILFPLYGKY